MPIPEFGEIDPNATYTLRPGAYAIMQRDHQIAVIQTPTTITFPGGGQDPDESLEQTAIRETLEETGLEIQILHFLGLANQLVRCSEENLYFRKSCHYYAAHPLSQSATGEDDHQLLWLPAQQALSSLKGGANIWALQQFLQSAT